MGLSTDKKCSIFSSNCWLWKCILHFSCYLYYLITWFHQIQRAPTQGYQIGNFPFLKIHEGSHYKWRLDVSVGHNLSKQPPRWQPDRPSEREKMLPPVPRLKFRNLEGSVPKIPGTQFSYPFWLPSFKSCGRGNQRQGQVIFAHSPLQLYKSYSARQQGRHYRSQGL